MAKEFWAIRQKHKKRPARRAADAGEIMARNGLGMGWQRPVPAPFRELLSRRLVGGRFGRRREHALSVPIYTTAERRRTRRQDGRLRHPDFGAQRS